MNQKVAEHRQIVDLEAGIAEPAVAYRLRQCGDPVAVLADERSGDLVVDWSEPAFHQACQLLRFSPTGGL